MTTLLMEYAVSPIGNFFVDIANGLRVTFEIAGRSRAAAELTRQGYHKEAKALRAQAEELVPTTKKSKAKATASVAG